MDAKKLQAARADAQTKINQVKKQQADVEAARDACEQESAKLEDELARLDAGDNRATDALVKRRRDLQDRAQLLEQRLVLAAGAVRRVEKECAAALSEVRAEVLRDLTSELKRAEKEARAAAERASEEIAARIKVVASLAQQLSALESEVARQLGEVPTGLVESIWAWVPLAADANPGATLIGAGQSLNRDAFAESVQRNVAA